MNFINDMTARQEGMFLIARSMAGREGGRGYRGPLYLFAIGTVTRVAMITIVMSTAPLSTGKFPGTMGEWTFIAGRFPV